MNKKQKLVARKHRRNQERLKLLRLASIAGGKKTEGKSAPKVEAKTPAKKVSSKTKVTAKKTTKAKTTVKKPVANKKATTVKKARTKASAAIKQKVAKAKA
jgi:hypothetical protein